MTAPTLLVVTDQLPYPPRNGITLPVYNYLLGLRAGHTVRLLLLVDTAAPPDAAALAENERLFGPIALFYLRRQPRLARVLGELSGQEMYQHGWRPVRGAPQPVLAAVDALLVSPVSALAKWRAARLPLTVRGAVRIAALNDCTAAEYYCRAGQMPGGLASQLKGWLDRLRSRQIGRIERALVAPYSDLLLQTRVDVGFMRRLVAPQAAARARLAPNGVRREYFALEPDAGNDCVIFVAELSGEYAVIAHWLVSEVWPQVLQRSGVGRLMVVGKGASPALRAAMAEQPRLSHTTFVPDLGTVYGAAAIALSPVFKGFGLINKTLEAMAAAVPVVGGAAAFNGIDAFVAGQHGLACRRSTAEFVDAIVALLGDPQRRLALGLAGRALVAQDFRWERTVATIVGLLPPRLPHE